ncbi:clathrin light chain-domain-containing protein [Auriculariales sp. MPI-PUGE-AT-0066]|nr:clathrin light chain-domain-containing protein [Auriculariales sp. MPI-PUGE-AT-0066]
MADLLSPTDEFDFDAASKFPDLDALGDGDIPISTTPMPAPKPGAVGAPPVVSFDFDEPVAAPVKVTGDDEIEKFESSFPDIGIPADPLPPASTVPSFRPAGSQPAYTPQPAFTPQPATFDEEEPEVIKQWREQQAAQIRSREEAGKKKRSETINRAEQAIDDFYRDYNEKKAKQIAANKIEEKRYLESLTDGLSQGTTWTRICDTIELQNSQSKTLARAGPNTTDLTRFRDVLLRLRREGDNAPGAAGY